MTVGAYIAQIRALDPTGKPVPSPVGPFPSRSAAWAWIRAVRTDGASEANVSPLHPPDSTTLLGGTTKVGPTS